MSQHWTKEELPRPTRDLDTARADIDKWGYCLLENALEEPLLTQCRARLKEQAAAEKQQGLAFEDGGPQQQWGSFRDENGKIRADAFKAESGGVNQRVWMLVNKGQCFIDAVEREPVLETVSHVLGEEFLISSLTANIAKPGGVPMDLHTDQWWAPEPTRPDRRNLPVGSMNRTTFDHDSLLSDPPPMMAPAACSNVLFMLDGMTEQNGGTRVVPGSHRFGRHPDKQRDRGMATVAAEGPPGCAIITDGRLWHGTGANVGNTNRTAMILTLCGPQYRPQENYTVGIRPDVYATLSDKMKALLGFKVWWAYGRTGEPTVEFIDPSAHQVGELRAE